MRKSSRNRTLKFTKQRVKVDSIDKLCKHQKQHSISLFFSVFAKTVSDWVGHAFIFSIACLIIIIWGIFGPYFHYSDTWQLIINTGTTIVTFLMVFIIQNTQNRDTEIINLKLDELIKSIKGAKNELMDLQKLSDEELKELEKAYKKITNKKTGD